MTKTKEKELKKLTREVILSIPNLDSAIEKYIREEIEREKRIMQATDEKIEQKDKEIAITNKKNGIQQTVIALRDAQLKELKEENKVIANENKTLFEKVNELERQNKNLSSQAKAMEEDMIKIEQESEEKDKEITKQKQKINQLEQDNSNLKREIAELKRKNATHCQDIKEAKEYFTQVLEENIDLQMKNNQLETKIEYCYYKV